MTVRVVENWSDITGVVKSIHPSDTTQGSLAVELVIKKVKTVENFANLLTDAEEKPFVVLIPEDLVKSLNIVPGKVIACRIRRTSLSHAFVHPDFISILSDN